MVRTLKSRLLCWLMSMTASVPALALEYGGSVETTQWSLSGSIFECVFEQRIPGYGRAQFYHQAGEDVEFRLLTNRNLMDYSQAQVSILPPPWQPSGRSEPLGTSRIVDDSPNLVLDKRRTNQFLHALLEGKWPTIAHQTYYDRGRSIKVHVSAVMFKDYYQDYLKCVDQLLPMNFEQVARSKVFFGSGERGLDLRDKALLDRIIFYVQNDPRVFAIYLDGHSDRQGRRYDNRQISKARVEAVERYFILKGVDPEKITTRFHGGRYPVANNATAAGRAENRRVTVRLEQRQDMELPPELRFQLPARQGFTSASR